MIEITPHLIFTVHNRIINQLINMLIYDDKSKTRTSLRIKKSGFVCPHTKYVQVVTKSNVTFPRCELHLYS